MANGYNVHQRGSQFSITEAKRHLENLRSEIANYQNAATANPALLKRSKRPNINSLARIPLDNMFANEMKEILLTELERIISRALQFPDSLREFDFANATQDRVLTLHINDYPNLTEWLNNVPPVSSLQKYNGEDKFKRYLTAMVTYAHFQNFMSATHLFSNWTSSYLLARRGIMAQFVPGSNNFQSLNKTNVLQLSDNVDFFRHGDYLYINNNEAFERVVQFRQITKQTAEEAFNTIHQNIPIRNRDNVLNALCQSARSMKRLAKTLNMDHIQNLDINAVRNLIENEDLPISVEDGELVVDETDKEQLSAFVYIVNDAYVQSLLTQNKYVVHDADRL